MLQNVGTIDKIIRYILAALFVVLALTISWLFWIPALIAAGTALSGFCPLYRVLGINTRKSAKQ